MPIKKGVHSFYCNFLNFVISVKFDRVFCVILYNNGTLLYIIYYILYIILYYIQGEICRFKKTDVYLLMDFKQIKDKKHYLYDSEGEFRIYKENTPIRHNWRHGEEGEWVFTDDGFVCELLRKFNVKDYDGTAKSCVRTVCGTFLVKDLKREMLGEDGIAENIYTFSGKNIGQDDFNNRKRNSKEFIFARYIADYKFKHGYLDTKGVMDSYRLTFPKAKSEKYIKDRCEKLLKTERIDKMIHKAVRKKLDEEGVTDNWLIERYKTIADMAESDNAKLRSLDSLAKISGLFDQAQNKSEQVTIWTGFTPDQLEGVKKDGKPELVAHAEKDENN